MYIEKATEFMLKLADGYTCFGCSAKMPNHSDGFWFPIRFDEKGERLKEVTTSKLICPTCAGKEAKC